MDYWIGVFTLTCIYLIAILGVSVLYGFTGLFTMGHAGFMSLGAYTSAIITIYFGVPNFVGIVAGVLVAALIGVLIGILTLRMSGDYFVIVTLGIGEAIRIIIQNLTGITGGARGLQGIPSGSQAWMVAVVLVTVVVFLAISSVLSLEEIALQFARNRWPLPHAVLTFSVINCWQWRLVVRCVG